MVPRMSFRSRWRAGAGVCGAAVCLLLIAIAAPSSAQVESVRRGGEERDEAAAEARRQAFSRLLLTQSRNLAFLKVADQEIVLHCGKVAADGADYENLEQLSAGEVQVLTTAAGTKLRTEVDLSFGGNIVPTGNLAEGYPGLYSVWLKRADEGWLLVFNREADVWGTQRDPAMDVEEVALHHETVEEVAEEMKTSLEEADGGGVLEIRWGRHRWTAAFQLAGS